MLSILAFVALGQAPPQMSADEIRQRLERPITLRTDPVRLSVALDEIGTRTGVRIRCESELQPAVVVVGVKDKPAKEVVKHLVDGIGAGTAIVNGTMIIGMRVYTGADAEKQRARNLQAIKSTVEGRAKQLKVDEPLDPMLAVRTAAMITLALQSPEGGYSVAYQQIYEASQKSPASRAAIRLMRAVGPDNLMPDGDRPKVVTMRGLEAGQAKDAQAALDLLATEQATWAKSFEQANKLAAARGEGYSFGDEVLGRTLSVDDSKPDGFVITVTNTDWGRSAVVEIKSGGELLFELRESLPRDRIYTNPGGDYFPATKATGLRVGLGKYASYMVDLRRAMQENKPIQYDPSIMKQIADAWRNEPLALTLAQPLADVASQLNLNVVAYLGDPMIGSVFYGYNVSDDHQVPADQVLNIASSVSGGFRKRGDWLLAYSSNPENYLENQIDRIALGRFLNHALKPGALTFEQFLAARKEMSISQLNVARQFARIIRPGFDSLNPVSMEMLEIFASLKPGQLTQAEATGIPFGSLAQDLQNRFRSFMGYRRRRARFQPEDTIDSPPSLQEVMASRVFLTRTSKYGTMALNGADVKRNTYNPYVNYSFMDFDRLRGYRSLDQILPQYNNQIVWLARMDTIEFRIEIQRHRAQGFSTAQYITDVTVAPLTTNQLGQAIARYFSNE